MPLLEHIKKARDKARKELIETIPATNSKWFELAQLYWKVDDLRHRVLERDAQISSYTTEGQSLTRRLPMIRGPKEQAEIRARLTQLKVLIKSEQEALETTKKSYEREFRRLKTIQESSAEERERLADLEKRLSEITKAYSNKLTSLIQSQVESESRADSLDE